MRRTLLGLALGVFASPAAAQTARTAPPPQRSARLGAPTAVPDPAPAADPGVTPAGLVHRSAGALGAPTPVVPSVMPTRPVAAAQPSVVEDRGTGPLPTTPVYPPGVPTVVVPSVAPEGFVVGPPGVDGLVPGAVAIGRVAGCGKWYSSGEYLLWFTKSAEIPPLVTTSSLPFNGRLGVGDTRVLLGGSFGDLTHSGGRVTVGRWFGDGQCRGLEARGFYVNQDTATFSANTAAFPLLARPFFNVNPNTPFFGSSSEVVADSVRATGGVSAALESEAWGAELNYRRYLLGGPSARLDALVGYRYFGLEERLTVTERFTRIPGSTGPGFPAVFGTVTDQFRTVNHFHGGQVGLLGEVRRGRWSVDGRVTVAFGNLNRTAEIMGGQSLVMPNGMPVVAAGGLLAVPGANVGRFTDNVFAVVPEVGLNVGYQVTSRMRVFVGYNFLYLSNALRPGDTIDTGLDAARIPNFLDAGTAAPIAGVPRPRPLLKSSDYYLQGITFGLSFNW
ncbi:MAG: hypothetical protein C0501_04835 [Isosphaera sp.]|nr:hypothetical protein [Isosphaera sp.]